MHKLSEVIIWFIIGLMHDAARLRHVFHSSLDFPTLFHTSFLWFHNDRQIPNLREMLFFHTSPMWETRSISRGKAIYWIIRDVTSWYFLQKDVKLLFIWKQLCHAVNGSTMHDPSSQKENKIHSQLTYGWGLAVSLPLTAQNEWIRYLSDPSNTARPRNTLCILSNREKCCTQPPSAAIKQNRLFWWKRLEEMALYTHSSRFSNIFICCEVPASTRNL